VGQPLRGGVLPRLRKEPHCRVHAESRPVEAVPCRGNRVLRRDGGFSSPVLRRREATAAALVRSLARVLPATPPPRAVSPRNFRIVRPRGSIRGRVDRGSVLI
jgi:hypothetical protein